MKFLSILGITSKNSNYTTTTLDKVMEVDTSDGVLSPCPVSPNCVCSKLPPDDSHYVEPLVPTASTLAIFPLLVDYVQQLPGAQLEEKASHYVRVSIRSMLMGFTYDLELFFAGSKIHVRSASRAGWYDFGVNRRRVETIRRYMEDELEG
ncbi:DUF1499 domain-containing protein [Halodesulfovibrio sp.]|jgi:uncharacterized protein (DUF1499 family)|uniref:DUF1499 domain-containing protein n=1 Tax=Halodesulfovibrio sp. TaxID=1912772 RepID=UPI0025DEE928|nr:DUF1499 domain-containing protein [Halodesulfovibrio sp.]MCT4534562.1 DUF1499 domain-containing protein [Halodesulfovibrio sp.]